MCKWDYVVSGCLMNSIFYLQIFFPNKAVDKNKPKRVLWLRKLLFHLCPIDGIGTDEQTEQGLIGKRGSYNLCYWNLEETSMSVSLYFISSKTQKLEKMRAITSWFFVSFLKVDLNKQQDCKVIWKFTSVSYICAVH